MSLSSSAPTVPRVVILGAGPAGIAAAWQLHRSGKAQATVLEQRDAVGGNAGSFVLDGLPVDYGSHRLHPSCRPDILADIRTLLGSDLVNRRRHGRIRLRGKWVHFPIRPLDVMSLPMSFGMGVAADSLRKFVTSESAATDATFASVLERGLGTTICRDFYFPYAVKIWGVPPDALSATQARRRVSANSLQKMLGKVIGLIPGLKAPQAGRFFYPRQGYGQISQALADAARGAGAEIQLGARVHRVVLGTPHRIDVEAAGRSATIDAQYVWSTIPVTAFAALLDPPAPDDVLQARERVRFRAMVLIYLVLAQPQFTPFDPHYFPEPEVRLTRLSEPKNYSARSDPADRTVLCGELPCAIGDKVWNASDAELADLVRESLARCGLPITAPIVGVATKRLPAAYPIYDRGYEEHFARLDGWIGELDRVLTFGRQGLFAHDNTHHTLAMAYAAVDCLNGSGSFDRRRWARYRDDFESHVVED
jgi:protoporphyrinogen oxidase